MCFLSQENGSDCSQLARESYTSVLSVQHHWKTWPGETIIVLMIISYHPALRRCKILGFTKAWIWVLPQEYVACVNNTHHEFLQKAKVMNHCGSSCSFPSRSDYGKTQFRPFEPLLRAKARYSTLTYQSRGLLLIGKTCITYSILICT